MLEENRKKEIDEWILELQKKYKQEWVLWLNQFKDEHMD